MWGWPRMNKHPWEPVFFSKVALPHEVEADVQFPGPSPSLIHPQQVHFPICVMFPSTYNTYITCSSFNQLSCFLETESEGAAELMVPTLKLKMSWSEGFQVCVLHYGGQEGNLRQILTSTLYQASPHVLNTSWLKKKEDSQKELKEKRAGGRWTEFW